MSEEWETEEGGKQAEAGGGEGREIFSLSPPQVGEAVK